MRWFHDKRVDRILRQEQRLAATFRTGGHGRSSRSLMRRGSWSQPLSKARMAELEARIEDLEGAMLDLEDNADQWADWWDAWKKFLTPMWYRFRYMA